MTDNPISDAAIRAACNYIFENGRYLLPHETMLGALTAALSQMQIEKGEVGSNDFEEACQIALEYRDECQAHLESLDADGRESDGSYTVGDPERSFGQIWAANHIGRLLRERALEW